MSIYKERRFDSPNQHLKAEELPLGIEKRGEMVVYRGRERGEYAERLEQVHSPEAREVFEKVCAIAEEVGAKGGRLLLVGGSVRDEVLGKQSKDFDVEIYGLPASEVREIVVKHGNLKEVGAVFGILKLTYPCGLDIDVSLPRKDSKNDEGGHTGFDVDIDQGMSIEEAAKRRDFTFNALSKDPLTSEIFDPYGGVEDLRTRTLRVTDPERFQDDPLRLYRAAQFVGRFGLRVEQGSFELMRGMVEKLGSLSKERIQEEWKKLLSKSERPSAGLQTLFDLGVIHEYYPELADLKDAPQEFEWHPEGDVWIHTLMVVDAARNLIEREGLDGELAEAVMWGVLCHDLGKPMTTEYVDGRIRSKGHEPAGEAPTRGFLDKLGIPPAMVEKVVHLVREHLWPGVMYRQHTKGEVVSDGAFRRLAKRIVPATIEELTFVSEADHAGRGPFLDPQHVDQFLLPDPHVAGAWVRAKAEELGIYEKKPIDLLRGKDLIALGLTPGKDFSIIIRLVEDARDDLLWTREMAIEFIAGVEGGSGEVVRALEEKLR